MTNDDRRLVLVVDVDQGFIDSTRTLLHDHRTLSARDLDEAREIVLGGRIDVVVLGPAFASEHSVSAASELRVADPSVEIVLAADIVTNRLLKAALRAGFADVVDLPLTAAGLDAVITITEPVVPADAPEVSVVVESAPLDPMSPVMVPPHHPSQYMADEDAEETIVSVPTAFVPTTDPPGDVIEAYDTVDASAAELPEPVHGLVVDPAPAPPDDPELERWAPLTEQAAQMHADVTSEHPPVWPAESDPSLDTPSPSEPEPEIGFDDQVFEPAESVEAPTSPVSWQIPNQPMDPPPPAIDPPAPDTQRSEDVDMPVPPVGQPPAPFVPEPVATAIHPQGTGHVIAVMAGKGGSGKSVIATNLAIAMGMRSDPERIAIVDADLQFGDVALMLQIDPVRTIDDVVGQIDSLTDARLDGALLRHESGLRVLPAPLLPVRAGEISGKSVVQVVDRLRSLYDMIIVDTGPVFDDGLVTILEHADAVVTVVDMDLPSVKNAKVALDALRAGGFAMEKITMVVNRVNSKARLDLGELERSLGLRVGGSVPSDRLVPQSVNEGIPLLALSPRSKVARSFMALAERLDPSAGRERLGGANR